MLIRSQWTTRGVMKITISRLLLVSYFRTWWIRAWVRPSRWGWRPHAASDRVFERVPLVRIITLSKAASVPRLPLLFRVQTVLPPAIGGSSLPATRRDFPLSRTGDPWKMYRPS